MKSGIIFDIKEFAINDGPGIRLTVFMKGCPLRCKWCHNPEGIKSTPELNLKTNKMVGQEYSVKEIISRIENFRDVFDLSNGGVTFSGGEPTLQSEFVYNVALKLSTIHKTLDTSGYCDSDTFKNLLSCFQLIYFDLKIINDENHKKYTGVSNKLILNNLKILSESNIDYHIRIPLIPNITDTKENLNDLRNVIFSLKNKPLRVDTLPYNICAGGKYPIYGMEYFLKKCEKTPNNLNEINNFRQEMIKSNINVIGEEIQCLQNV